VLGRQPEAKQTKVKVVLIAGQDWIERNQSYKANFVDKLRDYVLQTWKQTGEYDVVCEDAVIPLNEEEYLTGWLLKNLCAFFQTSRGQAKAFIDLTSAPKEWLFAAINVSNVFSSVELYYVKPMSERTPSDYGEEDIKDEGYPRLQTVRTGGVRKPLLPWTKPTNEKGEANPQYLLFQTIFSLAQSIAHEKGLDPLEQLHEVWVPIEENSGLNEYKNRLPSKLLKQFVDDAALKKSVSKHLTAVDMFKLFVVKRKSVKMTLRAAMLGQALFADKTKDHNRP